MGPFSNPIGIAIMYKLSIKERFNHVHQSMVYNPIAERRGTNHPPLGRADHKGVRWTGLITAILQRFFQVDQLNFQAAFKLGDHGLAAFAAGGLLVGRPQVERVPNLVV